MKRIFLSFLVTMMSVPAVFAQSKGNEMDILSSRCERVAELNRLIREKQQCVNRLNLKLDSLQTSWRRICEQAMNDSGTTSEDIGGLIALTDPEFDGTDLINELEQSQTNRPASGSATASRQARAREKKPEPDPKPYLGEDDGAGQKEEKPVVGDVEPEKRAAVREETPVKETPVKETTVKEEEPVKEESKTTVEDETNKIITKKNKFKKQS